MRLLRIPAYTAVLCCAWTAPLLTSAAAAQDGKAADAQSESEKKDVPAKVVPEKEAIKQL